MATLFLLPLKHFFLLGNRIRSGNRSIHSWGGPILKVFSSVSCNDAFEIPQLCEGCLALDKFVGTWKYLHCSACGPR